MNVADSTDNDFPKMRVGLFADDKEVDTVALKDGMAVFSEIKLGSYTMKCWDKSGDRIGVNISMKG